MLFVLSKCPSKYQMPNSIDKILLKDEKVKKKKQEEGGSDPHHDLPDFALFVQSKSNISTSPLLKCARNYVIFISDFASVEYPTNFSPYYCASMCPSVFSVGTGHYDCNRIQSIVCSSSNKTKNPLVLEI